MTGLFNSQIFNNSVFNTESTDIQPAEVIGIRTIHHKILRNSFLCDVKLFARLSLEIPSRITLKATLQNQFLIKITLGFERLKKFLALAFLILDDK